MSPSKLKSLSQLLGTPDSALARLAATARQKLALVEHIRSGLPADLAAELLHCAVNEDGTLIVRTSSPEWAARLRFENETLLALSREIHPETTSVKVRIAYPDG